MIIYNKKATSGDVYVSPMLIVIWVIVAASLVIGVILFYNTQADTRLIEADALSTKILDCVGRNFNYSDFTANEFDLFKKCWLNKKVLLESDAYFIEISLKDIAKGSLVKDYSYGLQVLLTMCEYQFKENKIEQNFAQCSKKSLLVEDEYSNKYLLEVITASNQK